jgi:hypothetical protein
MNRRAIEARLRELVRHVAPGATIYFPRRRPYRTGCSWNGRHLRPTGETLESQMHEVAHLLVAPRERLAFPEFGLGPDPYRRNFAERVIPEAEADLEEVDACTMQLVLVRLFGLNEAAVMLEVKAPPLTSDRLAVLRARCPEALDSQWWERAERAVSQNGASYDTSGP